MITRAEMFEFEGLQIESTVVRSEKGRNESIAFLIKSSFGNRATENWHNFMDPSLISDSSLLEAKRNFARLFAQSIRGVEHSRNIAVPLIRLTSKETQKCVKVIVSVDLNRTETVVSKELLFLLGIGPSTASKSEAQYGEVYELLLGFGDEDIGCGVVCAPIDSGVPCVLGSDFVATLRAANWRLYQRLLDHDVDIAYRSALYSRPNSVLLIGSFGDGRALLDRAGARLFGLGYRPVLLDDFSDIADLSLDQKVLFLSSVTGFVLCVDEVPAGHYTELSMCANLGVVTALLSNQRFGGRASSAMLYDLHLRNQFLKNFSYSLDGFEQGIDEAVAWASSEAKRKSDLYNSIYPWRA